MRLSVREEDSGYDKDLMRLFTARVFVDGKEAKLCITADEEAGYAWCHEIDKRGNPFVDPDNSGYTKKITLLGDVKIVIKKLKDV